MAALYHNLAYLAYALWGLMWGLMWGRKRLACRYEKFKKIAYGPYPDLCLWRSALPPPMLRCNIFDARCLAPVEPVSRSSRSAGRAGQPVEPVSR